ncbi:hypothetical protein R1sor_014555 [Riccia sorocarpa]|uniref:Cleft lip and palate associated transmembrane protein n=1 Tax=Riccia sorocarpa TaxID=122646 RepID=A0ABD3HBL4_9MARC
MAPPGGGGGTQVARAGGGGAAAQAQPQQNAGSMLFGIIRMGIFWYFAMQMFAPKKPANPDLLTNNLFIKGEDLDFWMYLSENREFNDFHNEEALAWHEAKVPYAVWTPGSVRHQNFTFRPSEAVLKHNASIYAHCFFTRSGYSPDPKDPDFQKGASFTRSHPLVIYFPKPKVDNRKSLLSKDGEQPSAVIEKGAETPEFEENEERIWVSFWKPNITINVVDDFTRYPRGGAPPNIAEHLNIDESTGNYYPTVYFNEFWLLRDKLVQINDTVNELQLEMELGPISLTRWQLYLQIDQSFAIHRSYGSMIEGEADELKRVFVEGNPVLLGITMAVSILHSAFDFLAFKNDIQFWNKNKSMEGLSARSVVINFFCQLIVFLYLLDNETSWMILLSAGVGVGIEFWKIGKAMIIEVDRSGTIPRLRFKDRESYAGNKTKEYDDLAMKYLSYALYPLVACFAIYSLMYEKHRSWYSWILGSLTSCVYTFGFIMMCPQLFINYKLKSVAHLPWRQMTYKFLNTIIDDLFAFVIKMPWLHRLSVFRDDVIFLIYIYQRWVYPVDKKRINEFGFGGAEDESREPGNQIEGPEKEQIVERPGTEEKRQGVRRKAGVSDVSKATEGSSSVAAEDSTEEKKTL